MLTCVSLEPIIYTIFQHVDVKHTSPLVLTWQQISKIVKRPRRSNYPTTQGSPKYGHSNKMDEIKIQDLNTAHEKRYGLVFCH